MFPMMPFFLQKKIGEDTSGYNSNGKENAVEADREIPYKK